MLGYFPGISSEPKFFTTKSKSWRPLPACNSAFLHPFFKGMTERVDSVIVAWKEAAAFERFHQRG